MVTVERYVVNEYEPAGKIVLVAGLLGPPGMLPDAPPLVLPPLLVLRLLISLDICKWGRGAHTKNSYADSSTR